MAFDFQKLADVEAVEEFPEDGASVLIEHEGIIKKCPADGIGGGGSANIPVFITARDEETWETSYELEDGRTADELVSDFEKNGIPLAVDFKVENSPGINMIFRSFLYVIYDVGENEEQPGLAGGKAYWYINEYSVMITNMDMESGVLLDHYIFTEAGG